MSFIAEDLCLCCSLHCCKDSLIMPLFGFIYLYCLYMGLSFPCPLKRERPGKSVSRERPSPPVGGSAPGSPCSLQCPANDPIPSVSAGACALLADKPVLAPFWPRIYFSSDFFLLKLISWLEFSQQKGKGEKGTQEREDKGEPYRGVGKMDLMAGSQGKCKQGVQSTLHW